MAVEVRLQVLVGIARRLEMFCLREGARNPGVANRWTALVDSPMIYLTVGTVVGDSSMAQRRDDNWSQIQPNLQGLRMAKSLAYYTSDFDGHDRKKMRSCFAIY